MVRELPCVHSQARSLEGLKAMLADAYVTLFPPPADEPFDGEAGPRLGTAELEFPYVTEPLPLPPEEAAELMTPEESAEQWRQVCEEAEVPVELAAAS